MASFSSQTLEGKKDIITHYLNDPKAQVYRQRKALQQNSTTTAKEDIKSSKPKKQIDYSTLKF